MHIVTMRRRKYLALISLSTNIIMVLLYMKNQKKIAEQEKASAVSYDMTSEETAMSTHTYGSKLYASSVVTHSGKSNLDYFKETYPHATLPDSDKDTTLTITSWTEKQPGRPVWYKPKIFSRCTNLLPWMRCLYTSSGDIHTISTSDVILFHARHIKNGSDIPTFIRPSHQKWVFFETEPPTNVWNQVDSNWTSVWRSFNVTATYSWDSHIPNHHHRVKCTRVEHSVHKTDVASLKTRKIAWFVSRCESDSARELYVRELRKFIQVDVYGACGQRMCDESAHSSPKMINCFKQLLNTTYKFYLSFENSFCREYSTEKLHRVLPLDVIPVVLGSYDYTNMLPTDTYIDVRSFSSPKKLAEYLNLLHRNDDLYNEFIRRRRSFSCRREYYNKFSCDLCEYLHLHRYEKQIVSNAAEFWSLNRRCSSPKEFYKGVADEIVDEIKA